MKNIVVIALNTFREAIRDRILYGLYAFAVLFLLFNLFLARVVPGETIALRSFGLAAIYLFGLIATIFLGSSLIYKEIEKRTIYLLLAKPVRYGEIILGKYKGLVAAIATTLIMMSIVYLGVIAIETKMIDWGGLLAIAFQLLEIALFVALLIFFSSAVSPLIAVIASIIILFVGHLFDEILKNTEFMGGAINTIVTLASYIFPNLEKFNIRNEVVHGMIPPLPTIGLTLLYAFLYSSLLLYASYCILKKRDL